MAITHHLDAATLMSFAAGSLPETLSAVAAAHVAMCPRCRDELADMELIGGAILDGLEPMPVAATAPAISLHSLLHSPSQCLCQSGRLPSSCAQPGVGEIPPPVAAIVGSDIDKLRWRRLGFGLWHLPLPVSKGCPGDLRLLKVAPGQAMPEHGHTGSELTLVLRGAYVDATGCYRTGDVADLGDDVEHKPVADPVAGCVCLFALDDGMRFKGLLAWLIQPLTGM